MKTLVSSVWTALFLLCAFGTVAFADVIEPNFQEIRNTTNPLLYVLLGIAVVAAALLIWRARKKKK